MVQDHIMQPLEMAFPEEPMLLKFVFGVWHLEGAAHAYIYFSLMCVFSHSLGLCDKGCVCLVSPCSLWGMV